MVVRNFHNSISNGFIEEVRMMLSENASLCNAFHMGSTPLQRIIFANGRLTTEMQVELLNILMMKGACSTTNFEGSSHILVLACQHGCHPDVFDCIVRWEMFHGFSLCWNNLRQYTEYSPLRMAAFSGSLSLLRHVMMQPMFNCYDITNSPLRLLFDAICYKKRNVVMFLLEDIGFKRSAMTEPILLYLEKRNYPTLIVSLDDILFLAFEMNMFKAVKALIRTFDRHLKPSTVFVCLYKMRKFYF